MCVNGRNKNIEKVLTILNTHYSETEQTEFLFKAFRALLMEYFGTDIPRKINPLIEYLTGMEIIKIIIRGHNTKFVILNPERLRIISDGLHTHATHSNP